MENTNNQIQMVVGSWGSYNACNDRALGSSWLDLSDFDDWGAIVVELKKQGFDLNGIDEELFIQEIEGIECKATNWDYMSPQRLFEVIQESDVLYDSHKYDIMTAYLEVNSLDEFMGLVDSSGSNWDDDIHMYKGFDWADYGQEMFDNCENKISDSLRQFIDFEAYGKHIGDYYCHEYSGGIIEIIT